jgi:hypothetical protein
MAEWTTNHRGDPAFGERQFIDPGPYLPPLHERGVDPFFKDARTYSDVATEEAAATPSGVAKANVEPGASEFSWGRGLMAPLTQGHEPTQVETMKAIQRTNPADPGATHLDRYADWIREA